MSNELDIKDFPIKESLNDADRLLITDSGTGHAAGAITSSDFKANVVNPEVQRVVELLVTDQKDIDAVKQEIKADVDDKMIEAQRELSTQLNTTTAQITSDVDEKIAAGVADAVAKPLVVSKAEHKAGTFNLGGDIMDIYEKTVQLDSLPRVAGESTEYVISDEPLGYGLYFHVESLVASSGKALKSEFFNSNYKVTKCYVNDNLESIIEVTCTADAGDEVKGILHCRYCKFYGDVVEFDVTLPTSIDKSAVQLEIPKLKYNKKLLLSYITDDSYSIYQFIFNTINKRLIAKDVKLPDGRSVFYHLGMSETSTDKFALIDPYYPDKFAQCTDGAGVFHRYATTVSTWADKLLDQYIGQDVSMYYPWISEKEFKFYRDFGFMLGYHDLIGYDTDEVDTQEKYDTCVNDTVELFKQYVGTVPKIMVEPNGDHKYITFSLNNPNIAMVTAQTGAGIELVYPFTDSFTLDKEDITVKRIFAYGSDLTAVNDHPQYFQDLLGILNTFNETQDLNSIYWVIGSAHKSSHAESVFIQDVNKLYGADALDNLWFPTLDEVYEYWFMRKNTTVLKTETETGLHFKMFVPKQQSFFFRDLSVMLSGVSSLSGVSVNSGDNVLGTSYAINNGKLLINLDFNSDLADKAEKYVSILENNPNEAYAYDNAVYFVQKLKDGIRESFEGRITALTSPPTLSTFTINDGSETQNNVITLHLEYTGQPPTHYIASESSDFSGATWYPYSQNPTFNLSESFGSKTVYVKLRNSYGESNKLSQNITFLEPTLTLNSISVNSGAGNTSSRTVIIGFDFIGYPTHYMISENSDFSSASWLSYTQNPTYTLSSEYGVKTVYVKLKNATTTTVAKSSSIELIDTQTVRLNSIIINSGDAETVSKALSIALDIINTAMHYKVGEQSDLSDCPDWLTYSASPISYTSNSEGGSTTVYVQVKNESSVSDVKSDSINILQAVSLDAIVLGDGSGTYEGVNVPVTLTTSGGTPSHYRVSETSGGVTSAAWVAYSGTFLYTFSSIGNKTLYVQVKNAVNESTVANGSVTLTVAVTKAIIGFNNDANNTVNYDVYGADTTNQIASATYVGYSAKQLKSSNGDLLNWYFNLQSDYYLADSFFSADGSSTLFDASVADDLGVYPVEAFSRCLCINGRGSEGKKVRFSISLPSGSYRLRILFSPSSSKALTEEQRLLCFYSVVQSGTELVTQVVGSEGFTGLGNNQYNNSMEFTVTDGQTPIDIAVWSTSSAFYRPGCNLLEISKLD